MSVITTNNIKRTKTQPKGTYLFFLFVLLYVTSALLPFFISIPKVPGMGFYAILINLIVFLIGFKFLSNKLIIITFGFAFLGGLYVLIDNYSAGYDHENPFTAFQHLFNASFLYLLIIKRRILSSKQEKILISLTILLIFITSITSIYGLFLYPNAARYMAGAEDLSIALKYMRLNIISYSVLYFFSVMGPTFIFSYFKLKKNKSYLFIGLLSCFAVIMGQITGIILIMIICFALYLIGYFSKSLKSFFTKFIILTIILLFATPIILLMLEFILPYAEGFDFLIPKIKESQKLLTYGLSVASSDDLISIKGYYERMSLSWSSFLSSPITGGEDSGAHHYWVDYLAENGLLGLILWLIFLKTFWSNIRRSFNIQAQIMIAVNLLIFIIFGLIKNLVLGQQAMLVFFLFPFIIMKMTENEKKSNLQ